jgi:phosphotriesterase-related protein
MPHLITTLGPKRADELGMILPHEHVFVDLRTPDHPEHGQGDPDDVIRLMQPQLTAATEAGITAIVEPSTLGVGRRADILQAVSLATGFPFVAPTGIYREPWVPAWAQKASEDALYEWMRNELDGFIIGSNVQAGWIKLSAGDDGLTPAETKILRAAARAARDTGAIIGSHTIRGRVVRDQLDILAQYGVPASRFIWIHTHVEPDFALHVEMARRGAWLEYDGITSPDSDEMFIGRILDALHAGFGNQLLLSQDRGWYDPAQPGGGTPQPFTYIVDVFLPKLQAAGVDDATVRRLMQDNPFRAFAR